LKTEFEEAQRKMAEELGGALSVVNRGWNKVRRETGKE
jgi:hypothetical protein